MMWNQLAGPKRSHIAKELKSAGLALAPRRDMGGKRRAGLIHAAQKSKNSAQRVGRAAMPPNPCKGYVTRSVLRAGAIGLV